ncbi:hypothetical protein MNBD_GAMMA24-2151 [hydrothermal vent metagenome]|uniref:SAM-dependent methyltransferase n=1 Tax=hydrothermal vent metagenome TaxID=652676 RepID=A0A3B1BNW4_9ZZZZ
MKPFAESCEQNKDPILDVLTEQLAHVKCVLEIGSGSGQHAVYFARHLPHLHWQTSDIGDRHAGIQQWIDEAKLDNLGSPLELDVSQAQWPKLEVEAVFSANSVHIMPWTCVEKMFAGVARILQTQGLLCLYGPFNYGGDYTSKSNEEFDYWLKARDPQSGIRDYEKLVELGRQYDLRLVHDYEMPANNRLLVWQKTQVVEF